MDPALWHGGGVLPNSNVISVHNQNHKIIQDHTRQTVKMGQIHLQFSKQICGNISLELPHFPFLICPLSDAMSMECMMYNV